MFVNWLHSKLRKIDKDGEIKEKILHFWLTMTYL
jgi:hypothetical protein